VLSNPDAALEWSDVAVCYLDGDVQGMTCPICLSRAVASLITACGHSFCAACIHRHLASHAEAWEGHTGRPPRCPLCMEVMSPDDLVACVHAPVKKISAGAGSGKQGNSAAGVVEFVLRWRRKGSAVSYPASRSTASSSKPRLESCREVEASERPFRTVLVCDDLRREWGAKALSDLEAATADAAGEGIDLTWLVVAADDVHRRLGEFEDMQQASTHVSSVGAGEDATEPLPAAAGGSLDLGMAGLAVGESDVFYFYQAADGQRCFLHPLNHRQLLTEVDGVASGLPWRISARVVDLEGHTCSESERRRLPFLGHLPLTASYSLAEVAVDTLRAMPPNHAKGHRMQPWRLSEEALAMNAAEISRRAKQRRKAFYAGQQQQQQQQSEPGGEKQLEALFGREHLENLRARVMMQAPDMAAEPTALAAYGRGGNDAATPAAIDAWRARQEAEAQRDAHNVGPKSGPLHSFAAIADRGFAAGLTSYSNHADSTAAFPALGGATAAGHGAPAQSAGPSGARGGWGMQGGGSPPAWGSSPPAYPPLGHPVAPSPPGPQPPRQGKGRKAKKVVLLSGNSMQRSLD